MATNPWAAVKPTGAWASQVDEEEAAQGGTLGAPEEAFPDLSVAATKKESKRDKKKKQTVSLAEFQTGKKAYQAPKRGPATEEIVLPSGPRVRDDDDDGNSRGGLGGAFAGGRDYKDRVGGFRDRDDDDDRNTRFDEGPSRADAADSWGKDRTFQPSSGSGGFGGRGRGGFEDEDGRPAREDLGPSKADTSASWGADRRQREPSPPRQSRGGGFGDSYTERDRKQTGGFADRYGEDRASFADQGPSKADQEDRWSRKPVEPSVSRDSERNTDRNSSFGAPRSDSEDRWSRRAASIPESDSSAGLAAPSERRRLNLAARTAPPKELPPVAAPTPKPAEDEPTTAVPREQPDAPAQPPKPRSNPFGTARPREDVLKEQGRDWKREERALEHSRVKRDPSEEEMQLGDRIAALQQRVDQGEADQPETTPKPDAADSPEVAPRDSDDSAGDTPSDSPSAAAKVSYAAAAKPVGEEQDEPAVTVQQALDQVETQLAKLTAELDDKVRFSKGGERESRWK